MLVWRRPTKDDKVIGVGPGVTRRTARASHQACPNPAEFVFFPYDNNSSPE